MPEKKKPTGPVRLQIEGNWKDAVKHALQRGKPPAKKKGKKKK